MVTAMGIDQETFRAAMRNFASGVTVVTTVVDDRPMGLTVSAFSSLSLEPPLALICIDRRAESHNAILAAGMFAVNILKQDQAHLSRLFASPNANKFASTSYSMSDLGLPILDGVLTTIECRVVEAVEGGDHTIFIGEALEAHNDNGEPLIYYQSAYHTVD